MRHAFVSSWVAATVVGLALAPAAAADPLTVVDVNAPAYQFVFSPSGSIVVEDTVDTFAISGTTGLARLQSRTAQGLPGAPAAGLYRYSYRLDLTNVEGIDVIPCISSLTLRFGSIVSSLDYNGDGIAGDQVYVITSGGLGSVGLASAFQSGSFVTFLFPNGGVCGASGPDPGESSFFFGLVSAQAPRFLTATVFDQHFDNYHPQVRVPKVPIFYIADKWSGTWEAFAQPPGNQTFDLNIETTRERSFEGTLTIRGTGNRAGVTFPVEGTLSASGRLEIVSRGRGAQFGAAANEEGDDPLFRGRYRLRLPDGSSEEGILTLALDARQLPTVTIER